MSYSQPQPPQPYPAPPRGVIPPYPVGFGEIFSASFSMIRRSPGVVFGASILIPLLAAIAGCVAFMILLIITAPMATGGGTAPYSFGWVDIVLMIALLGLLFVVAVAGAAAQSIVIENARDAVLGRKARVAQLWQRARPSLWRLVGLLFVQAALALGAIAILTLLFILVIFAGSGGGTAGLVLTVILGITLLCAIFPLSAWAGTKMALAPSIVVIEGAGPTSSILRSWRLTRGRFWVTFGVIFVLGLIAYMAAYLLSLPGAFAPLFGSLGSAGAASSADPGSAFAGMAIGSLIVMLIFSLISTAVQYAGYAIQSTAATLLYVDARMRHEGLHFRLQAHLQSLWNGVPKQQLGDPFTLAPVSYAPPGPPVPPTQQPGNPETPIPPG
ncbi:hypothetical protein G7067_05960 [Leucobacter insecticola]|uniref:Glycerophosphoryl diester phosphodiesterase membrane domain-containing protein n=1 Tax=Leucobacter insecticola TaxID=2714934 RepID=A0A6G8FID8_9MICO|nr:hypothetical protein [Leucobacter insecticola]QIM16063.1 hypothetical protein G7067_05960 [Leucobacter insecticola]